MFAPCRTCTLTLSHLAVFEQVEPGLNFIVISVSMKVSHHNTIISWRVYELNMGSLLCNLEQILWQKQCNMKLQWHECQDRIMHWYIYTYVYFFDKYAGYTLIDIYICSDTHWFVLLFCCVLDYRLLDDFYDLMRYSCQHQGWLIYRWS